MIVYREKKFRHGSFPEVGQKQKKKRKKKRGLNDGNNNGQLGIANATSGAHAKLPGPIYPTLLSLY